MRQTDRKALNSPVYFYVVFFTARQQELHWRYFKTMSGAIRYVRDVWGTYGLHEGMMVIRRSDLFKSRLGRYANGISARMDAHQFPTPPNIPQAPNEPPRTRSFKGKNWKNRVGALGNAVVPQAAYPFAVAIKGFLDSMSEEPYE